MKRNKHSLSHYHLATFNMGQLIPVANFEVLPGDSIRMSTSALLRFSPLVTPVMHPVQVRLHHWYVPHRIVWDEWEDFITGGPDGLGPGAPPTFNTAAAGLIEGTLGDHFGIPFVGSPGIDVLQFPFNAYNMIWNHNYRDQDLQAEIPINANAEVKNVCWEKDYLTSARPWPQKGPDITLPLGVRAPVKGIGVAAGAPTTALATAGNTHETDEAAVSQYAQQWLGSTANHVRIEEDPTNAGFPNIWADLANATAVNVNDVREAFARQRYHEARAQFGSRYVEYLQYLGVRSSDARLQLPEYLGGGKSTVSFSEVLKTGEGDTPDADSPIGDLRGHGISALRTRTWTHFFEEHGTVLTLCSIRPRTMYSDGVHRSWSRRTKEDYWQKELEQIGQQEVLNQEVYALGPTPTTTFGFQDRYSEYRRLPSYVSGEFRSTLNDWHLGRQFASAPALNGQFVECQPAIRPFADQGDNDKVWAMFSHSIQARRMVGRKTIGRIF